MQLWWDSHGGNEHVTSKHNAHLKHHAHLHHVVTTLIVSCVAGAHSGMKVTKRKRGPTKYQLQAKKALDAAQVALRQAKQKLVQAGAVVKKHVDRFKTDLSDKSTVDPISVAT